MKKQTSDKVGKVMKEYKEGTLHSGKGGPVVKSKKQAVAIALSEADMSRPKPSRGARSATSKGKKNK
jgi:hypothetical protein